MYSTSHMTESGNLMVSTSYSDKQNFIFSDYHTRSYPQTLRASSWIVLTNRSLQNPSQCVIQTQCATHSYVTYATIFFGGGYVLLTVYLRIFILVINQLDAQNFVLQQVYFMPLHVSSTMCPSSGGQNCIIQRLVSSHVQVAVRCTGRPPIGVMIPEAV